MTAPKLVRKRPITAEAQQFNCSDLQAQETLAAWCKGKLRGTKLPPTERVILLGEGEMEASFGDWIIHGVKGEFYPIRPDIFEITYEVVQQEHSSIAP